MTERKLNSRSRGLASKSWPVRRLTRDHRALRRSAQGGGCAASIPLTRLTTYTPPRVMPAVNVGVPAFEIPENAVRVLLTGYGVSLACTSFTT
jgi:hypothetical protein